MKPEPGKWKLTTIMMVWIVAQVAWIGYKSFFQPLYFSTGMPQFISAISWIKKSGK